MGVPGAIGGMDLSSIRPPLIVHVIHHLVTGGLENGLVNLINQLPEDRYRHAIVCMAGHSEFRHRIRRSNVDVHDVDKSGLGPRRLFAALYRLFRDLNPAIVHSRNLSGLDSLLPAALAGVPIRLHGEHGRDVDDLNGENTRLRWIRRVHSPLVSRYICVSKDLQRYLVEDVGVSRRRVTQIYNGVDTARFQPIAPQARAIAGAPWGGVRRFVFGTVGRLQPVKNHVGLLQGFRRLVERDVATRQGVGLAIVGDGPERPRLEAFVAQAGLADCVWLPGSRDDVGALLPNFDAFILSSFGEGISNTILEAMASGLPVIATAVGGNPELVLDQATGRLVPSGDVPALAEALAQMLDDREFALRCGAQGRVRATATFSLPAMVAAYDAIYSSALDCVPERARRAA